MNTLAISSATKIAGVIGDPIAHSLSPQLHNFLLEQLQLDGIYLPFRVKKENLELVLNSFAALGFRGCNITLPHKEEALKLCHRLSKSAAAIGAVNTIIIDGQGGLYGHNSDGEGFIKNILYHCPDFDFTAKKVVLLGAGGAARAICFALIQNKTGQITIINRDLSRATQLVNDFTAIGNKSDKCLLQAASWSELNQFLPEADLLINSTSLGMDGQKRLIIDLKLLSAKALVCDIVYKPLMTEMLQIAHNNGNRITTGIGMLIHQALVGFEMWYQYKISTEKKLIDQLYKNLV